MKKYFRQKAQHYINDRLSQLKLTSQQIEEAREKAKTYDPMVDRRAEFMYNYVDYDSDRLRVRSRFIDEINKKTTI